MAAYLAATAPSLAKLVQRRTNPMNAEPSPAEVLATLDRIGQELQDAIDDLKPSALAAGWKPGSPPALQIAALWKTSQRLKALGMALTPSGRAIAEKRGGNLSEYVGAEKLREGAPSALWGPPGRRGLASPPSADLVGLGRGLSPCRDAR